MKRVLLLAPCLLFLSHFSFGQEEQFRITIPREDPKNFQVQGPGNEAIILTRDSSDLSESDSKMVYRIIRGEGRKKDHMGVREKHKKYLVNAENDTLMTLQNDDQLTIRNSMTLVQETTPSGWTFKNEGERISEMTLLWNDAEWQITIINHQKGEAIAILNRYLILSMVDMAKKRSKCDCEDAQSDADFWFLMWAGSLGLYGD